ncbi:MAG: hypothetical protein ACR2HS_05895 [Gammaproteobacteria bacterium]
MKSKYELNLSSLLQIENESLRERLKDLKEQIKKLEEKIKNLKNENNSSDINSTY